MTSINDRVEEILGSLGERSDYLHPVKEITVWEAVQNLKLDVQTVIETKANVGDISELHERMTEMEDKQTDILNGMESFMERIQDLERACEVIETDAGDLREIVEVLAQGQAELSRRLDQVTTP